MPNLSKSIDQTISIVVEGKTLSLSHLNKVYFPEQGITKGELIQYYTEMAPLILPHLKQSPFVMVRFPEGIHGDCFYQKECPPQTVQGRFILIISKMEEEERWPASRVLDRHRWDMFLPRFFGRKW